MPLLGQASGGWTESSSQLRILNVGVRNTVGVLADDAFTQTNPPAVTVAGTITTQVDQTREGVLSGSVAFVRPGLSNFISGPGDAATQLAYQNDPTLAIGYCVLGVFINSAAGNAFENTPGPASGKGPYVSAQGTYGNALYETFALVAVGALPQGGTLTYGAGMHLMASRNGYIMPSEQVIGGAVTPVDTVGMGAESYVGDGAGAGVAGSATDLGVIKMVPDATQNEVVYDQWI